MAMLATNPANAAALRRKLFDSFWPSISLGVRYAIGN